MTDQMSTGTTEALPLGELVADVEPAAAPEPRPFTGRYAALHPVDPDNDVDELFANSHGSPEKERIWTYMPYGPFDGRRAMHIWLSGCRDMAGVLFFTVRDTGLNQRVGMMSLLNIVPAMRSIEMGNIWYSPRVHRTGVNTEVAYLMLCELFDRLRYRRVEWKCDALNARSRKAALRLGFSFEGIFRQHFVIKNRNRDTAWFAMIDRDWPGIKRNMERWLTATAGAVSLTALNERHLHPPCLAT
jgi:RimJ/RimL family protein N-acetyltransferase